MLPGGEPLEGTQLPGEPEQTCERLELPTQLQQGLGTPFTQPVGLDDRSTTAREACLGSVPRRYS